MKKHIILIIVVFISFTNCQQTHNNKENTSTTEEKKVVDTLLLNKVKCKATAKKDVEILLDSTIKVRNDTLYISYTVINNTSKNLLFYRILALDMKFSPEDYTYPVCYMHIVDSNGNLPQTVIASHRDYFGKDSAIIESIRREQETKPDDRTFAYILLRAGESKHFHKKKHIGTCYSLGKDFELKLRYRSPHDERFIKKFKRMQKKSPTLKEYERFEGTVESNRCSFTWHSSNNNVKI